MNSLSYDSLVPQAISSSSTIQSVHAERPNKRFKCLVCLRYLSSKHCLKEHNFTHTNERPYSCVVCSKNFKHASQLSVHKKTHSFVMEPCWPKLTRLLDLQKSSEALPDAPVERITLPPISSQQTWSVPDVMNS